MLLPPMNEEGEFVDAIEPESVYIRERIEWREWLADGFWMSLSGAMLFICGLMGIGVWLL